MTDSQPPPGGLSPSEALIELCHPAAVAAYQRALRACEDAGISEGAVPDTFFPGDPVPSPDQRRQRALVEECRNRFRELEDNLRHRLATGVVLAWARSSMRFGAWVSLDHALWGGLILDVATATAGSDFTDLLLYRGAGGDEGEAGAPTFWEDPAYYLGADGCRLRRLYERAVLGGEYAPQLAQCRLWDEGWADTIRDHEWAPAGSLVRVGSQFVDIDPLLPVSVLAFLGRGKVDPSGASPEAREAAQALLSARGDLIRAFRDGRIVAVGRRGQRAPERIPPDWWVKDCVGVGWQSGLLLTRQTGVWAVEYADVRAGLFKAETVPEGVSPRDDIEAEMKAKGHTQVTLAPRSDGRKAITTWARERWPHLIADTIDKYIREAIKSLPDR